MAIKKKVVKKKPVRRAKKVESQEVEPVLATFRISSGEEITGYVDDETFSDLGAILCYYPMQVITAGETVIMVPFGVQAAEKDVLQFPMNHIVYIFEVNDAYNALYHACVKANRQQSMEYHDQIIFNSTKLMERKIYRQENPGPAPTNADLDAIEKESNKKEKAIISSAKVDPKDTDDGLVDGLIKLAEANGKGRNAKI